MEGDLCSTHTNINSIKSMYSIVIVSVYTAFSWSSAGAKILKENNFSHVHVVHLSSLQKPWQEVPTKPHNYYVQNKK